MIWNEELSASLDQATGVLVFHRVDLSRSQQLAQVLADKVNALVEQNEKALDQKLGSASGWNDRGDSKGDKRGEQTQERKRGGERRGGLRGELTSLYLSTFAVSDSYRLGGARGGRGARFAQGLGNQMSGAQRGR